MSKIGSEVMRKMIDNKIKAVLIIGILAIFLMTSTFAVFRHKKNGDGLLSVATWDVSLNQTGVNGTIAVVQGGQNDSYTLTVTSGAEVDIRYSIILSNLPAGVEVKLDNGSFLTQSNNTISIADAGTILYTDSVKTKTHTLTFKADSNATVVNNQTVNVNVIVKQIV